ncbi:phenylacetate-coenzyme A ligase PaaK-like adenylate-forming protein [Bradyrhizobium sp. USDA 4011]
MDPKVNPIDADVIPAQSRADYHRRSLLSLWHRAIRHPATRHQFPVGAAQPTLANITLAWATVAVRDVYDHFEHLHSAGPPEADRPCRGSDIILSAGEPRKPRTLIGTHEEMLYNACFDGKAYYLSGIDRDDRVLLLGASGTCNADYCNSYALSRTACTIIPVRDYKSGHEIAKIMRELRATAIVGPLSALLPLLSYLELKDLTYAGIRHIVKGGEPLSKQLRARLAQRFGEDLSFHSVLQTPDHGALGFQCASCGPGEYHLHEGLIYAELRPRNDEGATELVVSNLHRSRTPVVRLRTGDYAEWADPEGMCSCGLTSRKIRILERIRDSSETRDGNPPP